MPSEIGFSNYPNLAPLGNERSTQRAPVPPRAENQSNQESVTAAESAESNATTQQQRAEAIERLEQQNFRVRRDDDSELSFQSRRAVDQFSAIEQQEQQSQQQSLLGIDLFA
ncbi:MAG: hypothetical protein HWE13_12610 [Gammaproteobacteria bacterium]|nr:hypothetical protein [Gammaproteobacteria bacterium]NVK88968.1 hypothetical protein [Gammaproteobacteria bacterium]